MNGNNIKQVYVMKKENVSIFFVTYKPLAEQKVVVLRFIHSADNDYKVLPKGEARQVWDTYKRNGYQQCSVTDNDKLMAIKAIHMTTVKPTNSSHVTKSGWPTYVTTINPAVINFDTIT